MEGTETERERAVERRRVFEWELEKAREKEGEEEKVRESHTRR